MRVSIHWESVIEISNKGCLIDYLEALPREQWTEKCSYGRTFLHCAMYGNNEKAVVQLILHGVDVNVRNSYGRTAMDLAAYLCRPRALEILCALGVNPREEDPFGASPFGYAILSTNQNVCLRVLVANGVRLNSCKPRYHDLIASTMRQFEKGVLQCRTAVIAMLRIKKAANLWKWDKYLLMEIGFAIWATRYVWCDV